MNIEEPISPAGSHSAIIHQNVIWEGEWEVGPFAIIGEGGEGETRIGARARIRSHTIIYWGNQIGAGFQTGHGVLIREENMIGEEVSIGSGSVIEHHVRIGDRVRLHSNVFVPEYSILEDECWIGPNVVLTNARYPKSPKVKLNLIGPIIERGAKIGANSTILPGVRIGRNALIGAGSVVTKDVPAGTVYAGNPAHLVNHIENLPY